MSFWWPFIGREYLDIPQILGPQNGNMGLSGILFERGDSW